MTLLAAAALAMAPGAAFGVGEAEGAEGCDEGQECTSVVAIPGIVTPNAEVTPDATPAATPASTPTEGVSAEPPVAESTPVVPATPVVPEPRIDTEVPAVPDTPPVVLEEPDPTVLDPVVEQTPVGLPNVPLAPDAAPGPPTGFVGNVADAAPVTVYAQPTAPATPAAASISAGRPDTLSLVTPDAPPVADGDKTAALAALLPPGKAAFDASAFTQAAAAAAFTRTLVADSGTDTAEGTANAFILAETPLVDELFSTSNEWIPAAVSASNDILEVLATYLIPGEGGSYTSTLGSLIQLVFILVAWMLIRPRPVSSALSPLRSSQRVGYRAVALRPG